MYRLLMKLSVDVKGMNWPCDHHTVVQYVLQSLAAHHMTRLMNHGKNLTPYATIMLAYGFT